MRLRVSCVATERVSGDFRIVSKVLGRLFAAASGWDRESRAVSRASSAAGARLAPASCSRALSRSTAWAYFRTCGGGEPRSRISASVSGPMRDDGGMRRVANGGVGAPFAPSTVTSASPMPSVVSVSSTS